MSAQGVEKYFFFTKKNVSTYWKDLAFCLGFTAPDINNIDSKPGDDMSHCMDLLCEWHRRRGNEATIDVLMKALTDAELKNVVDGLKESFPELKEEQKRTEARRRTGYTTYQTAEVGSAKLRSTAVFVYPETGFRRSIKLKDATPKKLKQSLKLPGYPDVLFDMEQDEAIFLDGDDIRSLFPGLMPDKVYEVQVGNVGDTSNLVPDKEYGVQVGNVGDSSTGLPDKVPSSAMPPRLSQKVGIDDIQRAMMCCQAIYQDGPEKVVQFLNKPENLCLHNFGEVCVSRHGRLTYMLAETDDKDELFIAFRGTQSFEETFSCLSFMESSMGGKGHAGFLKLASCFPVDPILRKYVYGKDDDNCVRIVVCGHSMGGAVAHIVTLNMLADLKRCSRDTEKVLSVAIGAPFFGDREMRSYAEKHDLSDNLLTIVNQNDPVPWMLQLLFQCATEAGTKKGIVREAFPTLQTSLQALLYTGVGGLALAGAAAAIATVGQLSTYPKQFNQSPGSNVVEGHLKYTPLGWYMLITHHRPPGAGQKNQWHVSYIEAVEEVMQAMEEAGKKQWTADSFKEHKISEYATVYPKTTVLGQPTKFDVEVVRKSLQTSGLLEKTTKNREVVHYNPFNLVIGDVSVIVVGAEGSKKQSKLRIIVTGQNLDFFVLPQKPFTGIPADIKKGIKKKVNTDEVTLEFELEAGKSVNPVPKVHFTTHFEQVEIPISTKQVKEIKVLTVAGFAINHLHPAVLIKAILRSLSIILLTPDRKKATESDTLLKLLIRLDAQRKSVREGKDEVKLKKMIDDAKNLDDLKQDQDLFQLAGEIMAEFGQYLEVKYSKSLAHWLMSSLRGLVWGSGAGRDFELNYKDVLRMLIKELPEPLSQQEGGPSADDETVYSLERALHIKYKGLGFLNKPVDDVLELEPFKDSPKLKDSTEESQKEALRRCQMACDLFAIRQLLRKSCVVGLVGPQNAGKSTLIEKTWGVTVKRGLHIHTWSPDLYKAKGTDRMVMIDFPGTTTIDDEVSNTCGGLSSIIILVMPFQGDPSMDYFTQLEKANKLADDFDCTILLCITHCGRFPDILKDKETLDALRKDYTKHLKIDPANILFTELVETEAMESRGVVGADGVRKWLKDWLIKYDVFEEKDDELYAAVNMTRE